MKTVLLDTNFVTALFQGDNSALKVISNVTSVYMSVVVIGELEAGFQGGNRYMENLEAPERFIAKPTVVIIPVTRNTSKYFGQIKYNLKRRGTPIPLNDIWIAAQCIEHNAPLATYDKHFKIIESLQFWKSPT